MCSVGISLSSLAVTPLLAAFVLRVNKGLRTAVTEVRTRQSDLLATLQEGLQSIEVVKAFTREDRQEQRVQKMSMQTVTARLQARRATTHNYIAYNSAMHIAKQFTYTSKPALTRRRFRSMP